MTISQDEKMIERGCNICNNMIPPYDHSGERCPMLTREMRPSERAKRAQDGVKILSESRQQIGDVAVTFRTGRIV